MSGGPASTGVLGRSAFAGAADDAAPRARSFAGETSFDGCVTFASWPRAEVARLLPPELQLAANVSATPDIHPVAFVFGQQRNGTIVFARTKLPMGITYGEFGMIVPFVRYRGGPGLHAWVARMYSAYFPVVWDGNFRFGFSKETARMSWMGGMFVMTTDAGALLFHAAVEPGAEWSRAATCTLPIFATVRDVFALPMLGRRPDRVYVRSEFDWDFTHAVVRPADAWISLDAPLVPGAAPLGGMAAGCPTFAIRGMLWRLTWPSPAEVDRAA